MPAGFVRSVVIIMKNVYRTESDTMTEMAIRNPNQHVARFVD